MKYILKQIAVVRKLNAMYVSRTVYLKKGNRVYSNHTNSYTQEQYRDSGVDM